MTTQENTLKPEIQNEETLKQMAKKLAEMAVFNTQKNKEIFELKTKEDSIVNQCIGILASIPIVIIQKSLYATIMGGLMKENFSERLSDIFNDQIETLCKNPGQEIDIDFLINQAKEMLAAKK